MKPWDGTLKANFNGDAKVSIRDSDGQTIMTGVERGTAVYICEMLNLSPGAPPVSRRLPAKHPVELSYLSTDHRDATIHERPHGLDLILSVKDGSYPIVATFWPDQDGNYDHAGKVIDELGSAREMRAAITKLVTTRVYENGNMSEGISVAMIGAMSDARDAAGLPKVIETEPLPRSVPRAAPTEKSDTSPEYLLARQASFKAMLLIADTAKTVEEMGCPPEQVSASVFGAIMLAAEFMYGPDHPLTRWAKSMRAASRRGAR